MGVGVIVSCESPLILLKIEPIAAFAIPNPTPVATPCFKLSPKDELDLTGVVGVFLICGGVWLDVAGVLEVKLDDGEEELKAKKEAL